jgi:hypothetical protein
VARRIDIRRLHPPVTALRRRASVSKATGSLNQAQLRDRARVAVEQLVPILLGDNLE